MPDQRICFLNLVSDRGTCFAFCCPPWTCSLYKRGCTSSVLLVCQCSPIGGNDSVLRHICGCKSSAHVSKWKFSLKFIIINTNVMLILRFKKLRVFFKLSEKDQFGHWCTTMLLCHAKRTIQHGFPCRLADHEKCIVIYLI